ncbi:hypothetical protein PJM23_29140, partial [Mycobacterium kansasii]
ILVLMMIKGSKSHLTLLKISKGTFAKNKRLMQKWNEEIYYGMKNTKISEYGIILYNMEWIFWHMK